MDLRKSSFTNLRSAKSELPRTINESSVVYLPKTLATS